MPTSAETWARVLVPLLFAIIGAAAGYVLHRIVGCPTGGCPITSNAWVSMIYGLVIGLALGLGAAPARHLR
jgi:hypothetical protein